MYDMFQQVLADALAWAKKKYAGASPQKLAAFANSVAYGMTGWAGGYGGPSVREHVAGNMLRQKVLLTPNLSFEEACAEVEGLVFGPLTPAHQAVFKREHTFDDDPADLEALHK
jgi:hypothetical protein